MRGGVSSVFVLALAVAAPASAATPAQARALAAMFAPATAETRAVLVMHGGKLVAERYRPGYGPATRFISWSMAKSITATLVGVLVDHGKLHLDAPAPVAAWRGAADPRRRITLRQLLHMSAGLRHDELGDPDVQDSDTNRALFTDHSADSLAAAVAAPPVAAPGTKFEYSTLTSGILAGIIQQAVASAATTPGQRRAAMRAFIAAHLGPVMPGLACEYDARGTMLGGSFCHATARDWARFGQLYLGNGKFGGQQVVSAAWVAFARTPSSTNPSYGGHFWLNRVNPAARYPALFPDQGPPDAYSAIGHLGQYVTIVPSKRLVVVRLGKTADDDRGPIKLALGKLVNAYK